MSGAPIHAGCVAIGGRGVLIAGPSGSGKSDLAIRLINRGAALVADDYCRLSVVDGRLVASAPDSIAGKIELRGVGILARPFLADAPVALLIDLGRPPERLPTPAVTDFLGVAVPTIGLNGLEPSAPIKVEAALALHGLPVSCP